MKKTPTAEPILPSSNQQQTSPVIKVNVFSGGPTKQNSLLLPSKFSPVPHKEEHSSRGYRTEQDGRHTSLPTAVQPSPHPKSVPSNTSEFERLLARQREKVESDQPPTISSQPPPPPSTNGGIIHQVSSLDGMKAATDMDLPKKKAPKPPRRTSSFKSYLKPAKYEKYSNNTNTSELMFRRHNTAPQLPPEIDSGKLADCISSSSTSPSTGQSRLSSVE